MQCNIIDQSQVKYLQTIKEEEEHDVEGKENTFEMMNMSPGLGNDFSPDKRNKGSMKKMRQGGSFIGGSFIGGEGAAAAPETEE